MTWFEQAIQLLGRIETTQAQLIEQAAVIAADAIGGGGVVHAFGTGHSRMPVEELFPRYGSYPGWHPIVELSMTFHTEVSGANGQRQAMFIERVPGLAAVILSNFTLRSTDALVVFSATGRNAVPVEMARLCRAAGLRVIAVTSAGEQREASDRADRLVDHADVVIDLCTPIGDAAISVPGWPAPVGPLSSIANVGIANALKVRTAELLAERGIVLPVLASGRVVGPDRSVELFEDAYLEHARRKAAVLRTTR